jgi:lysophospholipase L1-like esterase
MHGGGHSDRKRRVFAKREYLFGIITALLSIGFVVLSMECFVRFIIDDGMQYDLEMWKYARDVKRLSSNPDLGHEHAPKRRSHLMGVDVETNSRGLRDREFSYDRLPGKQRIVMLGDSLTLGWGVPIENTFSKRIEKMYDENGIQTEVINTGVGNYNTVQEVTFFLTEGFKYKPDIVVLNFFVNDAEIMIRPSSPSWIARRCYSCNFVAGRLDSILRRLSMRENWSHYYLSLYDQGRSPGWLEAKDHIRKLADYCKTHNIKLLIVSLPELHNVGEYRFQRITELVRQTADELGVAFTDVVPYLKSHDSADLWVTVEDPHPNSLAHRLIAQAEFDALERLRQARSGLGLGH